VVVLGVWAGNETTEIRCTASESSVSDGRQSHPGGPGGRVLYNEIDEHAVQWLANLASRDLIAPGEVSAASIAHLDAKALEGLAQFHTFAGIGTWSCALRDAGWPDDVEVWTGSCPCQPFSSAGSKRGLSDDRHLWPEWFRHIREHRPPVILGEQVASPDGLAWLDVVLADLEGAGYACAAFDLCAAGVGAPHIRQRIYFVALADGERLEGVRLRLRAGRSQQHLPEVGGRGTPGVLGDAGIARGWRDAGAVLGAQGEGAGERLGTRGVAHEPVTAGAVDGPASGILGDAPSARRDECEDTSADRGDAPPRGGERSYSGDLESERAGATRGTGALADAEHDDGSGWIAEPHGRSQVEPDRHGPPRRLGTGAFPGTTTGFWSDAEWVWCRDEKYRPVEPGSFPLANGATTRVGPGGAVESQSRTKKLKGYGNSIVREVAVTFIEAVIDVIVGEG